MDILAVSDRQGVRFGQLFLIIMKGEHWIIMVIIGRRRVDAMIRLFKVLPIVVHAPMVERSSHKFRHVHLLYRTFLFVSGRCYFGSDMPVQPSGPAVQSWTKSMFSNELSCGYARCRLNLAFIIKLKTDPSPPRPRPRPSSPLDSQ